MRVGNLGEKVQFRSLSNLSVTCGIRVPIFPGGEIQRGKGGGDKRPGRVVAPSCLIWKE